MENIRKAGKNHRGIMTAVVICLCLAMVIGFATWGAMSGGGGSNGANVESQIAYYENYVTELLTAEDKDSTTNGQVASVYETLAGLYEQQQNTEKVTECNKQAATYYVAFYEPLVEEQRKLDTDSTATLASYLYKLSDYYTTLGEETKSKDAKTEALGYYETNYLTLVETAKKDLAGKPDDSAYLATAAYYLTMLATVYNDQGQTDKMTQVYTEASEYYGKIITLLPENTVAADRAVAYTNYAGTLASAAKTEEAKTAYETAIGLAPENIEILQAYTSFVLNTAGVEAARDLLPQYAEYYPAKSEKKEAYDNLVSYIDFYYQLMTSYNSSAAESETSTVVPGETTTAVPEEKPSSEK